MESGGDVRFEAPSGPVWTFVSFFSNNERQGLKFNITQRPDSIAIAIDNLILQELFLKPVVIFVDRFNHIYLFLIEVQQSQVDGSDQLPHGTGDGHGVWPAVEQVKYVINII